jgi:hypothetical protein
MWGGKGFSSPVSFPVLQNMFMLRMNCLDLVFSEAAQKCDFSKSSLFLNWKQVYFKLCFNRYQIQINLNAVMLWLNSSSPIPI